MIPIDEYVSFLGGEYLRGYVDEGGAAVKFVVPPDDPSASVFLETFTRRAADEGYTVARVDAALTRVHLLEQVFFEIARQIDWDELATVATGKAVAAAGYPVPPGGSLSLDSLASHYRVDARELKRDVDRQLQDQVQRDYGMVQEFRTAMLRLCQAQLHSGQVVDAEHAAVLDWLRGDLRQISVLKSALIFRRIGRHNRAACAVLAGPLAGGQRPGRPGPRPRHSQVGLCPPARSGGTQGPLLHQGHPP